eukprot:CAMPEP_0174272222 /NCGR_PEP_ID=MMETSP0439-20130205/50539_1 /TAXON_ID=0 /ORGANISM="Stereomyxa ramosa, Strain Chinc5" /LENGTH=219 /DNA_ID=CAMNT_0015362675 /DNA_START=128 /DNA_END=787 /DNA_ORIENTATION=+
MKSTLQRFPDTFFEALVSERHCPQRDSNNRIFVDRNPHYFSLILDFLRDQAYVPQIEDEEEIKKFKREVSYFGMNEYIFPEETGQELCEMAYAFARGIGVNKDLDKAVELLTKAADLGSAKAQNRLAMFYYTGKGVKKDHSKAASLYASAAEQGLAWAQYNLGLCYKNGYGVPVDEEHARCWFLHAAKQGHTKAQQKLTQLMLVKFNSANEEEGIENDG